MSNTLLVASLTQPSPPLAAQIAAARRAGADAAELRVDAIADAAAVEDVLRARRDLPLIVTIRPSWEGGLWDGDEADRISLHEQLGLLRPDYIDIEAETWRRSANIRQKIGLVCQTAPADARVLATARPRSKLILSHHEFRGAVDDWEALAVSLAATPAEIIKVACMAHDASDALRVLAASRHPLLAGRAAFMAMGEAGLVSRVLGPKFGARLTYAAPSAGAPAAPGQPTLAELREMYSWERIGPKTRLFGVVGWPVSQSRGPHLHNAAMRHDGIDGVYVPLPVRPEYEAFAAFMDLIAASDWLDCGGLSVTIPHKEHALRWLSERGGPVSEFARRIGAVNTLTPAAGGWNGENTDAAGVVAALESIPALKANGLSGARVMVLGAGGAARAAVVALQDRGAGVTVFNRSLERAEALSDQLSCGFGEWKDRQLCTADIVVNCTKIGMTPDTEETPLADEALRAGQFVFDTVYNPPITRLLREAAERGCLTISGAAMFLGQAAEQYRLWHDRPAPIDRMRASLESREAE